MGKAFTIAFDGAALSLVARLIEENKLPDIREARCRWHRLGQEHQWW